MNDLNAGVPAPKRTDLSISMEKAGIYSLVVALPIVALLAWLYILRWGADRLKEGFNMLFGNFLQFLIIFFLGILVHELIHGLTWMLVARKPLSAIKFGFQLKTLTPYAHCTVPMKVNPYRMGSVMPGVLLGLLPALIAIINGNGWWLAFGILFTVAAGGDFLILWLIRNVEANKLVEDHPTQAGCLVLNDSPQT